MGQYYFIRFFGGLMLTVMLASHSHALPITQLSSEADFTSSEVLYANFDAPLGSATEYAFDNTASLFPSNTNQFARSGNSWLGDNGKPLTVTFSVETYEVGAYMGNDDDNPFRFGGVFFGQVDFFLDAYDTGNNFLGTVSVAGTGNDLIDQFIGLRSDVALGSAVFRNTSDYFSPGIALDDFYIGYELDNDGATTPVPEPTTMLLFGTGIAGLAAVRRKRK